MENFPRGNGHCYSHDVSDLNYIEELENYLGFEQLGLGYFEENGYDTKVIFGNVLKLLKDRGAVLIKGDLILFCGLDSYRNDGIAIFDGNEIIELNYDFDNYGCLPDRFKIINDDVPITYWLGSLGANNPENKGIAHNNISWFDHSTVKQQCLDTLKIKDNRIFFKFVYGGIEYTIYYMDDDQYDDMVYGNYYDVNNCLEEVRNKISNSDLLMLDYDSDENGIKLFLPGFSANDTDQYSSEDI